MSVLRNTLLSTAALVMAASTAMAGEKLLHEVVSPVVAKLLILPGGNSPTGYSDLDSPARDVSLGGAFTEGSSTYNGQNDQNNRTDIIDDAELGKTSLSVTKAHKPVIVKRKTSSAKKRRTKVVRLSISRKTVKRRAPLMLGVYR
jgi:hypothetical protein